MHYVTSKPAIIGMTRVLARELRDYNINVNTLPTDADLANLRVGDVYRDVGAGNVLKIKV